MRTEYNGVNIGRIESKMGCHGSATCEINFEDVRLSDWRGEQGPQSHVYFRQKFSLGDKHLGCGSGRVVQSECPLVHKRETGIQRT